MKKNFFNDLFFQINNKKYGTFFIRFHQCILEVIDHETYGKPQPGGETLYQEYLNLSYSFLIIIKKNRYFCKKLLI